MQKLTLANVAHEDNYTAFAYDCDFTVQCDGSSIWGDTNGRSVHVTGVSIVLTACDDEQHMQVNVTHDSTWDIYTDKGFERAICDALGLQVSFTEQGMQEDEYASMEA